MATLIPEGRSPVETPVGDWVSGSAGGPHRNVTPAPHSAGEWSILGVKFTEAPLVARHVWDRITGARSGALPARPPARDVPTLDQLRAMTDPQLRDLVRTLAAEEWVVDEDDLVWRRTDLWMDPAQRRRAVALMA